MVEDIIRVREVQVGDQVLVARLPVIAVVQTELDEHDHPVSYSCTHPVLGLMFHPTREGLDAVVHETVAMMWNAYVLAEPNKLAPCAQQLRTRLQDTFKLCAADDVDE